MHKRSKFGYYFVISAVVVSISLTASNGAMIPKAYAHAFVFGIGQATIPNAIANGATSQSSQLYLPEAVARFPSLVGQVIVVGGAFATLWIWKPVNKISWLSDTIKAMRRRIDNRIAILMIIGSGILLAS